MKGIWRKLTSLFLALILTLQLLPVQALAAEANSIPGEKAGLALVDTRLTESESVEGTEIANPPEAEEPQIVAEIPSGRDKFQKEFRLSNGMNMISIYGSAVHYEEDGEWKEIDNTLQPVSAEGAVLADKAALTSAAAYKNTAGMWDVKLPATLSSSTPIEVSRDGYTLSFQFAGEIHNNHLVMSVDDGNELTRSSTQLTESNALGLVGSSESTALITNVNMVSASIVDMPTALTNAPVQTQANKLYSAIEYSSVYPNTDLRYDLQSHRLKESVIIKSAKDTLAGYRYTISAPGMTLELQEDNSIHVYAADAEDGAEPLFYMPSPFLVDDNMLYNEDITISLQQSGNTYTLTYSIPRAWLLEEERAYPVVLDPVVQPESGIYTISDQTVFSNKSMSYTWACLGVGKSTVHNNSIARALLKFDNLPQLTSSDVIVDSQIYVLKCNSSESGVMEVHEIYDTWESHSVTWSDMAVRGAGGNWNTIVQDYQIVNSARWYNWDVTNIAQKWYASGENTGMLFCLPASLENSSANTFREFYSSDWGGSYTPQLTITYLNNNGLEDIWDYTSQNAGRAGTGYINNFTGNLVWIHDGLSFSGNRMPVSISHVYNANDKSNNNYGLGHGWRTNYNQLVYQWTSPGEDPITYYVWEDQDGTRRYFYEDPDSSGTYINETDNTLKLTASGSGDKKYCIEDKDGNKSYFDSNGRLKEIHNNQKTVSKITIYYTSSTSKHIDYITDGVGRLYDFTYTSNLLSNIAFKGTGTSVISDLDYTYSGTNLISITYPDNQSVTYGYTDNHLLTSATDVGGYKVTYAYNITSTTKPNRVIRVTESDGSTTGGSLNIEYAHNQTTFTDHNGNKEIVQFNNYGSTVSIQDGLGRAQFAQYAGQGNPKSASQLTLSSKLQNTVVNVLRNGGFEWWDYWSSASGNASTGSWDYTDDYVYRELYSLKINRTADSGQYTVNSNADSACVVEPGKSYVLSAYVKTTGMNGGGNGAKIALKLANSGVVVSSEAIKVNSDWTRLTATYTHPANAANQQAVVQLSNESSGTAYFDAIMLERAVTVSRHNLVENGDFGRQKTTSTDAFSWHEDADSGSTEKRVSYTGESAAPQLDNYAFTMTGDPYLQKRYYQTVLIAGQAGDVYSVSGWGKGDTVPLTSGTNRRFGILCRFFYTDGSTKDTMINFNPDTDSSNNWQFVASRVVAEKAYTSLRIFLVCDYNMNTVYFDGIQVFKEEFGQSYDYDPETGLVTSVIDLQQKETTYEYANNNLTKMVLPSGASQTYTYDNYHNVLTATSPEGVVSTFTYDDYGNNLTVSVGSGDQKITSSATYTSNGNLLSTVTDPLGKTTTYGYEVREDNNAPQTGLPSWIKAPGETAVRTDYTYDDVYRTETVAQGSADVTYSYETDLLNTIKSASDTTYDFDYGVFDLLQSVKVGTRTLISHEYSASPNFYLTKSTYGNGHTISYSYDDYGRTTAKTYKDGVEDTTEDVITYAYDNNGNLGLVSDSATGRTTKYLYDFQDRLSRYEELGTGYSSTVTWGYDTDNNLTSQTHVLNGTTYTTGYTYDDDNRLTGSTQGTLSSTYAYDALSRMTSITAKNGSTQVVKTEIGYTGKANSTTATSSQVATWKNTAGSAVTTYTYAYDDQGNITSISDGTWAMTYEYDEHNQLVRENNPYTDETWVYSYDDGGNIKSVKEYYHTTGELKTLLDTVTYTYGDSNGWKDLLTKYNGRALSYDGIGNLTSDGTWTYTWEHGRQLAGMSKSGTNITYAYNADGMRVAKTVNGTTYSYHYVGDTLTGLTCGDDELYFIYDAIGPAAVIFNGTRYYYVRNAQGDITAIVTSSGTQVARYSYNAWGKTSGGGSGTVAALNPFRYRGYVYDTETGLYYLQSRYYNPAWGRFINADAQINTSLGLLGFNLYAYCLNNPTNKKDFQGDKPGDLFNTADAAAIDFANYINGTSITENREYASYIYTQLVWETKTITVNNPLANHKGLLSSLISMILGGVSSKTFNVMVPVTKYTYREPKRGTTDSCMFPINWARHDRVGLLHSHAAYDSKYRNDAFSQTDLRTAKFFGLPSYISTPLGIVRKYDPTSGQDIVIYENAPFDPNHPGV